MARTVLTIPPTHVTYSLLVIDVFGDVIPVSIKPPKRRGPTRWSPPDGRESFPPA